MFWLRDGIHSAPLVPKCLFLWDIAWIIVNRWLSWPCCLCIGVVLRCLRCLSSFVDVGVAVLYFTVVFVLSAQCDSSLNELMPLRFYHYCRFPDRDDDSGSLLLERWESDVAWSLLSGVEDLVKHCPDHLWTSLELATQHPNSSKGFSVVRSDPSLAFLETRTNSLCWNVSITTVELVFH